MTRGKCDDVITHRMKTLQLRSEIDRSRRLTRAAQEEARDANRVSGSDCTILVLVKQDPRKHSVEIFWRINAIFQILAESVSHGVHICTHVPEVL